MQSGGDVDTIAVNIIVLDDHIAQVDADAYLHATVRGHPNVTHCDVTLCGNRTAHRVNDARELHQYPVTHQFDDTAAVLSNSGCEQLLAQRLDREKRAGFVHAHEPRVTYHVGNEYSSETPLH